MPTLTPQQALEQAVSLQQAGRLVEAETLYRRILEVAPQEPQVLHRLGLLRHQLGDFAAAVELISRSINADPKSAITRCNLGRALLAMNRAEEAVAAFSASLKLDPSLFESHNNLGNAYLHQGNLPAALRSYLDAIRVKPDSAVAHLNHGAALRQLGRLDDAVAAYETAIKLDPAMREARVNLAAVYKDQGRLNEAMSILREALTLNPDDPLVCSAVIYLQYFMPGVSQQMLHASELEFNERFKNPALAKWSGAKASEDPNRALRIGYVSPDFNDHVVGRNILPLFKHHDRSLFYITCYSNSRRHDGLTTQFQSLSDNFRTILGMPDDAAARLINADRIDILVDLSLHLNGNRLPLFAHKPAPVQVTFAGYPGSTGLSAIDYRLTDPYLDPPGTDALYSEASIRLPRSFWCYDPIGDEPQVNDLPAISNGFITFGCLNNFCKINSDVLNLWARLLEQLPTSRLVILAPPGSHRQRVLDQLKTASGRVVFVDPRPRVEYLKLFHKIDLALDTFPYNGHTTSLDGLYMGVPMVSLAGPTIVSRAGVSQLSNLGLNELIAESPEDYLRIAGSLAADLTHLAQLRSTLRGRMKSAPLTNARQFARDIESALRSIFFRR